MRITSASRIGVLALLGGCAVAHAPVAGRPAPSALEGAWRMMSRSWTIGDSTLYPTAHYAQPGLLIISGKYYSLMYVFTDTPRPLFPTDRDPSDAELARAFNTFYASGGRVERTDTTLTIYTDVAKGPNAMATPSAITQRWRISSDTLWLEKDQLSSADPALARPVVRRTTYVRAPQ